MGRYGADPRANTPHGLRCAFHLAQLVDFIATFFLEAVGVRDAAKLGAYNEPAVRDSRFHVRVLALRSDFEDGPIWAAKADLAVASVDLIGHRTILSIGAVTTRVRHRP